MHCGFRCKQGHDGWGVFARNGGVQLAYPQLGRGVGTGTAILRACCRCGGSAALALLFQQDFKIAAHGQQAHLGPARLLAKSGGVLRGVRYALRDGKAVQA